MARAFADIAFTPQVRAVQEEQGTADANARFLLPHVEGLNRLGEAETEFISARDGFYQATVSETGWPYVQFRGGPAGFIQDYRRDHHCLRRLKRQPAIYFRREPARRRPRLADPDGLSKPTAAQNMGPRQADRGR